MLLAAAFSVQVRSKGFTEGEFARLAASVALAFPLVFALSVLRVRGVISRPVRWTGTAGVLAACAAFGLWALHADRGQETGQVGALLGVQHGSTTTSGR